jgi:hypothetical protein
VPEPQNPERRVLDRAARALHDDPIDDDTLEAPDMTVNVDRAALGELIVLARHAIHDRDYWRSETTRYSETTRDLSWRLGRLRDALSDAADVAARARQFLASFDRLGQNIDHETIMTAVTMVDGEEVVGVLRRDDLAALLAAVEQEA